MRSLSARATGATLSCRARGALVADERAGIRAWDNSRWSQGVRKTSLHLRHVARTYELLFKPPPLRILYSTHDASGDVFSPPGPLSPGLSALSPLCLAFAFCFSLPSHQALCTWCFRTASADLESNGYVASLPGWKRCLANVSGSNNKAALFQKYSWRASSSFVGNCSWIYVDRTYVRDASRVMDEIGKERRLSFIYSARYRRGLEEFGKFSTDQ